VGSASADNDKASDDPKEVKDVKKLKHKLNKIDGLEKKKAAGEEIDKLQEDLLLRRDELVKKLAETEAKVSELYPEYEAKKAER